MSSIKFEENNVYMRHLKTWAETPIGISILVHLVRTRVSKYDNGRVRHLWTNNLSLSDERDLTSSSSGQTFDQNHNEFHIISLRSDTEQPQQAAEVCAAYR